MLYFGEQNKTWRVCKINIYSFCLPAKNKRHAASDNSIKSCISVCVFCHVHGCVSPLSAPLCQPLPTTQHTAVQQWILQAPIFGWIPFCNNWIIAVREGFSSDYTDYGLQLSDGQCGLKSIIWLVSLRKSFLANVQIWCLSTFTEKKAKSSRCVTAGWRGPNPVGHSKGSTSDRDYFCWIRLNKRATTLRLEIHWNLEMLLDTHLISHALVLW